MKRIGIDARLYFQTGVGVYIRNLLHNLEELDTSHFEFFVYVMKGGDDQITFTKANFKKKPVSFKWHTVIEQVGFLGVLLRDKLDLMHFTYFSHPIFYNKPFIATVHDVTILEHKTGRASTKNGFLYRVKHQAFVQALTHQIKKSKAIITPTHTVKKQVLDIFGKKYDSKITVIYEGVDYKKMAVEASSSLEGVKQPYFLYVGNFYPHKNVERLVEAFAQAKTDGDLILVGPQDFFSKRIAALVKQRGLEDKVKFYFNASDEDLKYLYLHAEALIHPSLSEGVGLPLVEAAYLNIPILASDIAVYKEILGNSYTSFDAKNTADIARTIESFRKGKPDYTEVLKAFSFPKMAESTLALYKKSCNYEK
jgi:glycosyltransferase involved in cell wall biosynthesis